jgi:hypothetical protein
MTKNESTTIKISKELKDRLRLLGTMDDTYETIIERLLLNINHIQR